MGLLFRRFRRWAEQFVLRGREWGVGGSRDGRDLPEHAGFLWREWGERNRRRPLHLHAQPVGLDHGLRVPHLLDCRRLRMGRGGHRRDSADQALNRFLRRRPPRRAPPQGSTRLLSTSTVLRIEIGTLRVWPAAAMTISPERVCWIRESVMPLARSTCTIPAARRRILEVDRLQHLVA